MIAKNVIHRCIDKLRQLASVLLWNNMWIIKSPSSCFFVKVFHITLLKHKHGFDISGLDDLGAIKNFPNPFNQQHDNQEPMKDGELVVALRCCHSKMRLMHGARAHVAFNHLKSARLDACVRRDDCHNCVIGEVLRLKRSMIVYWNTKSLR